jgi:hypothetical protein
MIPCGSKLNLAPYKYHDILEFHDMKLMGGLSQLSACSYPKGDPREMRKKSTQADMVFK